MTLTWDLDPILIHITQTYGIRYYGLLFSLVFVGGFLLFRWQIMRAGGMDDDAYAIIIPGALGTVIGARLGHVFFYAFDRLLEDPLWLFRIWEGGLASHGAVIGLALALVYYCRRLGQSYLECVDRFVFSAAPGGHPGEGGEFFEFRNRGPSHGSVVGSAVSALGRVRRRHSLAASQPALRSLIGDCGFPGVLYCGSKAGQGEPSARGPDGRVYDRVFHRPFHCGIF